MTKQIAVPDPKLVATDESGEAVDTGVIEQAGMGFDPFNQTVDLTKAEKLRTTALMLAINAYQHLIIKDAEYLKEMHNESRREGGPVIRPATMDAMITGAINFEAFLLGRFSKPEAPQTTTDGPQDPAGGKAE